MGLSEAGMVQVLEELAFGAWSVHGGDDCVPGGFCTLCGPYPQHAGKFVDFKGMNQPPTLKHLMGTDTMGRDILSRIIFALATPYTWPSAF